MSFMKIILIILRILVGFLFIFSAYVKLFPVEIIEVAIVETGLIGWTLAPFAARVLVGIELFLGIMLMSGFYEKLILKLSISMLSIFTVYLLLLLIFQGNNTNCNCFGLYLTMTPVESIIKNCFLIIILVFVFFKRRKFLKTSKLKFPFTIIIGIISLVLVFIFVPVVISTNHYSGDELNYKLNFDLIYDDPGADQPQINLESGKHCIVFLSSSCPHCIVAGYKFHVLKQKHHDLPVFFFINGDEDDIRDFHFKTRSEHIPYAHIKAGTLIILAGNKLPAVFWLENGTVVNKVGYYDIDEQEMIEWAEK